MFEVFYDHKLLSWLFVLPVKFLKKCLVHLSHVTSNLFSGFATRLDANWTIEAR